MTPESLIGQTITVQRPSGVDRYGDTLPTTQHTIDGCVLAPVSSAEVTDRADQVTTRMSVHVLNPDTDVVATDRVVLADGTRWAVVGDPDRFRSPFVANAGVCVIHLERVTG
jgi:hypothetical protein